MAISLILMPDILPWLIWYYDIFYTIPVLLTQMTECKCNIIIILLVIYCVLYLWYDIIFYLLFCVCIILLLSILLCKHYPYNDILYNVNVNDIL